MTEDASKKIIKPSMARHWDPDDREFLPAALELLETPPSPVKIILLQLICCFVTLSLLWSYFGRIDIIASAQGKVQPAGAIKVIQSLETARVRGINVQNGMKVKKGELLIQLDEEEIKAELEAQELAMHAFQSESVRRRAAIDVIRSGSVELPELKFDSPIPYHIRDREIQVFKADLSHMFSIRGGYKTQQDQKNAEISRIKEAIASQEKQILIAEERTNLRRQLAQMELGSRLQLLDARENLQQQLTSLAQLKGQLSESILAKESLRQEEFKAVSNFIAENSQKLADAQKQIDDTTQKVVKAKKRLEHMFIISPIEGTIQALTINTVGQVVSTGSELMRIIPANEIFEIECYVANKDIGFIKLGQEAVVKLDAFPFTQYGSIKGKVSRIASDAMPEPEAQTVEGTPGIQKRQSMFASIDRIQNLVFPVTIALDVASITVEGVSVPLSSGMTLTTEIKTGDRRILEFLFSPIVEVKSKAMGER